MRSIVLTVLLVACGSAEPEDCAADEVLVQDACTRCGSAGGCDTTEPACLPACEDTGFDCVDGARRQMCD
jgi:hypothetical protein